MHLPNMFDAKIRNKSKVNYIYVSRVKNDVFEGKKYVNTYYFFLVSKETSLKRKSQNK